jgi:hypothetical protein
VLWLEDFKSRYGEYEEATATINEVEDALRLYKDVVESAKVKLEIQRAIEAKKEQGSVLEYGLDFHLSRFVTDVSYTSMKSVLNVLPMHYR